MKAKFEMLQRHTTSVLESCGFHSRGPFAEDHGTTDIVFCKAASQKGELDRLVVVAVEPPEAGQGSYEFELWAGADSGDRFTRRFVLQFSARPEEIDRKDFQNLLKLNLSKAVQAAEQIGSTDLSESYPPHSWRESSR